MLNTLERKEQNEALSTKEKISHLHDVTETCFRCKMGGMFARSSEIGFSGDAASLFTLVEIDKEVKLVKVGWGEFSHETFDSKKYPQFKESPVDLYCVSQSKSYFPDSDKQFLMNNHPVKYLEQNALFVAVAGNNQEKIISNPDHYFDKNSKLKYDLPVAPYDEILCNLRNQAMKESCRRLQCIGSWDEGQNVSLSDYLPIITSVLKELHSTKINDELGRKMIELDQGNWLSPLEFHQANQDEKNMFYKKFTTDLLLSLGVETCGSRVGDEKSMQSIRELLDKYDFEKQLFVK